MAQRSRTSSSRSRRRSNGRSASQKSEKYRFAQNVDGEETIAEHEYRSYAALARDGDAGDPDVLLDVPVVKVDSIHLEVEDVDVQVSLQAKVLELLELDVGVEAHLGKLKIDIKGVEAQALLKVRLDHVTAIVDRVMTTLDRNPELVKSLGKAVEDVGKGAGHTLGEAGEAVDDVGEGAEQALGDVGQGAGEAVGQIGEGAGQGAGELGQGAGQAAGQLGEGAGGADSAPKLAKAAAKTAAKEIGAAASDEAKDLGMAATRKVKEIGERRRQKRAERHHATPAALRVAGELDMDLDEVEGTGAEGRITVNDVRDAAEED